jgi:hypothetical protein
MNPRYELSDRTFLILSYCSILAFSAFPLLFSLPFRIHLDLPYEGAYRMYLGQVPFKDFGIPFGYGFFIVPTLFFHLFGPTLHALLCAQVFLNIVSGLAVLSIFKSLRLPSSVSFVGILVYCLSYIFIYFWPWHTHTAYTFGIVAIAFILAYQKEDSIYRKLFLICFAGCFSFLSFFTKQDYGGLNLLFCGILLLVIAYFDKSVWSLVTFGVSYLCAGLVFIGPLPKEGFGYWFNHGQAPHSSRLEPIDFLNEFFGGSDWEKFYLLAFCVLFIIQLPNIKTWATDKKKVLLWLICLGMVVEAILTKVTSRMSTGTTTYYHAFALVFLAGMLHDKIKFSNVWNLATILLFTIVWWSPMYWKYAGRIFNLGQSNIPRKEGAAKVQAGWELSSFKTLKKIKLPPATIQGMERLKQMPQFGAKAQVMNMTELTSLPEELGYVPLSGIPLWYDLGVSIFPKQVDEICANIGAKKYDVFLFEVVPSLDNFYPEDVRKCLQSQYKLVDTFLAPRKEEDSTIEVYIKP